MGRSHYVLISKQVSVRTDLTKKMILQRYSFNPQSFTRRFEDIDLSSVDLSLRLPWLALVIPALESHLVKIILWRTSLHPYWKSDIYSDVNLHERRVSTKYIWHRVSQRCYCLQRLLYLFRGLQRSALSYFILAADPHSIVTVHTIHNSLPDFQVYNWSIVVCKKGGSKLKSMRCFWCFFLQR